MDAIGGHFEKGKVISKSETRRILDTTSQVIYPPRFLIYDLAGCQIKWCESTSDPASDRWLCDRTAAREYVEDKTLTTSRVSVC